MVFAIRRRPPLPKDPNLAELLDNVTKVENDQKTKLSPNHNILLLRCGTGRWDRRDMMWQS